MRKKKIGAYLMTSTVTPTTYTTVAPLTDPTSSPSSGPSAAPASCPSTASTIYRSNHHAFMKQYEH